jgi:dTDP-4-dehydrorhamnose reductase
MQDAGEDVIGTTRRTGATPDRVSLDLAADQSTWVLPNNVDVAYICAGETNAGRCKANPEATAAVNVAGTVALVKRLVDQGARVVHMSSSHVFDGEKPGCTEDDPICPVTEYGRQKATAEAAMLGLGEAVSVVRCTRILGDDDGLISSWLSALSRGEAVEPFTDMFMSPVPVSFVVSALRLLGGRSCTGIWHVSGDEDVCYADVALWCAESVGADASLVRPVTAASKGYAEITRRYNTLSQTRLMQEFGIRPPPSRWTIGRVVGGALRSRTSTPIAG